MRQNPARQPRFGPIRLDASPQRAVIKALRSQMREEHVGLARQDQLDFEPAPGQPRHLAQGAAGRQKAGADNRNLPCAFEVSAQGQFDRIVPARAGEKNLAPGECDDPLPSRFAQAGKRLCLRLAPANISSEAAANSRAGGPRIFRPKSRQPDAT